MAAATAPEEAASSSAVQALLRERVGISEEMLEALLNASATSRGMLASPASSSASPGSISVSLRSSLFEDDELAPTPRRPPAAGAKAGGAADDRAQDLLLEELEAARYEKRLLEVNYRRMEQSAAHRLRETSRRFEAQVRGLKQRVEAAERGLPDLQRRLDAGRADFADGVQCSASQYDHLKKLSEDELTIRELVLVKVFELTASLRAQLAEATARQEGAVTTAAELEARTESAEARLASERAKLQGRTRELENDLARAQDEAAELKAKHLDALRQLDRVREDSERTGALRARIADLERELANAHQVGNGAVAQGEATQQTLALKANELEHALRDLELVKQDKAYLGREADARKLEVARLTSELGREQDRVESLRNRLDEAREHLHEARQQARSEYEELLAREVESMRDEYRKQIAQLKETQLGTAEREARAMRAAREEALAEADHLRAQLADAQTALDEARVELATKDAGHEAGLAQARGELNRRVFEIETLSATVDAKMAALRKLEIENEMLRDKFNILRDDFAALETSTAKTIVERTARISTLEEKVRAYEALELELDAAVVDQARQRVEAADEGTEEADSVAVRRVVEAQVDDARSRASSGTLLAGKLPIAAQRRVQQSVLLAEKLVRAERELEASRRQVRELEAALRKTEADARSAVEAASSATQPQAYLLEKLRDRDAALERADEEARTLRASLHQVRQELAEVEVARDALHADLERVLNDRRALERAIPRLRGRSPAAATISTGDGNGKRASQPSPSLSALSAPHGDRSRASPSAGAARSPQSAPAFAMIQSEGRAAMEHLETESLDDDEDEEDDDGVDEGSRFGESERLGLRSPLDADTIQEVDTPDVLARSSISVGSAESSTFVLHRQDDHGIPLPKWYRKLRQQA